MPALRENSNLFSILYIYKRCTVVTNGEESQNWVADLYKQGFVLSVQIQNGVTSSKIKRWKSDSTIWRQEGGYNYTFFFFNYKVTSDVHMLLKYNLNLILYNFILKSEEFEWKCLSKKKILKVSLNYH